MFQSDPYGILAVIAFAMCLALATVLYRVGMSGSVAMPNTQNTPEYIAGRKMQVYESALADALLEGGISDKERSLLNTLRDTLGISSIDATTLEGDLQARNAEFG